MLVKNKKVYLEEQILSVNVPQNTDIKKIVADLIELNFFKYFIKNKMVIDMNDVLFISDSVLTDYIDIDRTYFEQFDKIAQRMGSVNSTFSIPTVNALKFMNPGFLDEYSKTHERPTLIILGFINNIPEDVYVNLTNNIGRSKLLIFGDEVVSGVELDDYFSSILTNAEYNMVFPYSDNRQATHKKINSLISKLRDKKTQTLASVPSNSSNISKTQSDEIDVDYIMSKLDLGCNVVVPRRMFCAINSKLFNTFSNSSKLQIQYNDMFYTRFPFITDDEDGKPVVIPAMSKVVIELSQDLETTKDGIRVVLRDVTFTKPNGAKIDVRNVPIDYSGYLLNFDGNEHIDNYDDYELIEYDEPNYYDPQTLSILPFRVFTEIEQKYITSIDMLLYKETFENDIYIKNRNPWFQEIFNVIETLEIIHDTQFNDL